MAVARIGVDLLLSVAMEAGHVMAGGSARRHRRRRRRRWVGEEVAHGRSPFAHGVLRIQFFPPAQLLVYGLLKQVYSMGTGPLFLDIRRPCNYFNKVIINELGH